MMTDTSISLKHFMDKYGFRDKDIKCVKCGKPAIYNEHFFLKGYACIRFKHDCPEKYWVTSMVPITDEEKDFWKGVF